MYRNRTKSKPKPRKGSIKGGNFGTGTDDGKPHKLANNYKNEDTTMFKYGIKKSNNLKEIATFVKKCAGSCDNIEAEEANAILGDIKEVMRLQKHGVDFKFKDKETYEFGYDYFKGVLVNQKSFDAYMRKCVAEYNIGVTKSYIEKINDLEKRMGGLGRDVRKQKLAKFKQELAKYEKEAKDCEKEFAESNKPYKPTKADLKRMMQSLKN